MNTLLTLIVLQTKTTTIYDGTGSTTIINMGRPLVVVTILTQTHLAHITSKTWLRDPRAVHHELLAPESGVPDRGGARVTTGTEALVNFPFV